MVAKIKKEQTAWPLISATVLVVLVVTLLYMGIAALRDKQDDSDTGVLRVISYSTYRGTSVIIFQDTLTNRRILHYRDAMVVLPELPDTTKAEVLDALIKEYETLISIQ